MNDNRVTVSSYAWAAVVVAFLLIFGSVWFASSLGTRDQGNADAARPDDLPRTGQSMGSRVFAERVPAEAPVAVVRVSPENPPLTGLPGPRAITSQCAPRPKPLVKKITPRDMFPVGDITRDMPIVSHPYRQVAELFPSFDHEGRLWRTTGKFVRASEVDLVPTGYTLATGQGLFALANTSAPDAVLFVESKSDPSKFAVYRRL